MAKVGERNAKLFTLIVKCASLQIKESLSGILFFEGFVSSKFGLKIFENSSISGLFCLKYTKSATLKGKNVVPQKN